MDLSFLKNVEVKEVKKVSRVAKDSVKKIPVDGADFRIYKNGLIFTHPTTAIKYSLEYGNKNLIVQDDNTVKKTIHGNGLDIFSSENWSMVPTEETILFIAIVPREGNSKIDVYGTTSYNEDGSSKRSIDANFISTFGKDVLVDMLSDIYAVDWSIVEFIDLNIVTEYPIESPNDLYSIPKIVSRGKKKGQPTLVIRKDIKIYPLVIFEQPDGQVDLEDAIVEAGGSVTELDVHNSVLGLNSSM